MHRDYLFHIYNYQQISKCTKNAVITLLMSKNYLNVDIAKSKLLKIAETVNKSGLPFRDSWDKCVPQIFENCLLGHMLPVIAWFKQISDFFD